MLLPEINLFDAKSHHPDEPKFDLPKGVEVCEIEGPFFFGIANRFDETMRSMADNPHARIIRMRMVPFVDSTAIHNLATMIELLQGVQYADHIECVQPKVMETLRPRLAWLGEENRPLISAATERVLNFYESGIPQRL